MIRAVSYIARSKDWGVSRANFVVNLIQKQPFIVPVNKALEKTKMTILLPLICGSLQSGKREKHVKRSL